MAPPRVPLAAAAFPPPSSTGGRPPKDKSRGCTRTAPPPRERGASGGECSSPRTRAKSMADSLAGAWRQRGQRSNV
jgi:hypothetical protein